MKRLLFAALSAFFLTAVLAASQVQTLREEQTELLETIDHLNHDHLRELHLLEVELHETKTENKRLIEILENRRNTYQAAVELRGAVIPVLSESGFSAEMFERVWNAHGAENLKGSGEAFVRAEQDTGVNALVLAAIAVHETGWGQSALARHKHNYFGWGAFGPDPYRAAHAFSSREEGIRIVAEAMRVQYLSSTGRYFNGGNLAAMNRTYAADRRWADKIARIMASMARTAVVNPGQLLEYLQALNA